MKKLDNSDNHDHFVIILSDTVIEMIKGGNDSLKDFMTTPGTICYLCMWRKMSVFSLCSKAVKYLERNQFQGT